MNNTLQPIQQPYPDDVAAALAGYPRGKDGYILKLFRVFANSLRFLTNKGVANLLDEDSPLSLRERELIILRATAIYRCEYEWGVHVTVFAKAAGLSHEQVVATAAADTGADCWSEREQLLLRCVDELCGTGAIRKQDHARFQHTWSAEQQLEILSVCGNYHTVCMVANTAQLTNESFGARFPR